MTAGLAITAVVSWFAAASPTFVGAIANNGPLFWGLVIAQLVIVVFLSARVEHLAASTAAGLFRTSWMIEFLQQGREGASERSDFFRSRAVT
jgi:FtsH-binding integral membrane protein